ncbi:unnamed protein product [Meloidogyne enterolobii]|uniref:Uncharacterized protein n=1 Tax=Meloidogyne enterolobii TaxID=390850 RepID=A0ACB1ARN6_MELEN
MKLGRLVYENQAKISSNDWLGKEKFCFKFKKFEENFEEIYKEELIQNKKDFETVGEWKRNSMEKNIEKLNNDCLKMKLDTKEKDPRRPLHSYPIKEGPKCSRWYPDSSDHKYGRKPLWSILNEIHNDKELSKSTKDFCWNLINNLFLPLPQRRRAETAILYCKNVLKLETDNLNECLKKLFEEYNSPEIKRSELLELLIVDKSEALAERLFYTLNSESIDFDTLYDIILARPKFELKKIIEIYDSEPEKELDKVEETDKNEKKFFGNPFWNKKEDKLPENPYADNQDTKKEKVKLGKVLLDKKKADQDNKELWDIIINRVKYVTIMDPSGYENFEKISNEILSFCENFVKNIENNNYNTSNFIKYFARLLSIFEFKSKKAEEFGKKFTIKCKGIIKMKNQNNEILPEYIKRMLIITGLAGKGQYNEDIANRINYYNEKLDYEGL